MVMQTGLLFFTTLFCMIGGFLAFSLINRKGRPSFNAPFFAVSCLLATAVVGASFVRWAPFEFVSEMSLPSFIAPAVLLVAICLLTLAFPKPLLQFLALLAACFGVVFGFGLAISFFENLPLWFNQGLTALLWLAICYCPRVLNVSLNLVILQTLTISLGCSLLYLANALPAALGLLAFGISGLFISWLITARQYTNILISDTMCNLLGFMLGWLIIYCSLEGAGSCVLILGLYPLLEIIFALAQKLTFLPQFAIAKNNTLFLRMADSGLPPALINRHLLRINAVCILFASFQIFAPNPYSIPVFCLLVIVWQLYKIYNWHEQPNSLKETNQKLVKDVKSNIEELSKTLRRKDKK